MIIEHKIEKSSFVLRCFILLIKLLPQYCFVLPLRGIPNLITVLGVLEAVKHIKLTNVNVCVISYIALGFKGAKVGNGLYANEVNEIVRLIAEQGNTLSSIAVIDGKDVIKKIILEGQ